MAEMISTPVGDLEDGAYGDLVLRHGESERALANVRLRAFHPYLDPDGNELPEVRYEAVTDEETGAAVGFLAEHVVAFAPKS